jgi:uncharacterized protein
MTDTGLIQIQLQIQRGSVPTFHVVESEPRMLLSVNGSGLFAIPQEWSASDIAAALASAGAPEIQFQEEPSAISLNVAQTCNLSCSYCYADEGRFGKQPRLMPEDIAFRTIDRLIEGNRGQRASIGFIGGEPLLNRELVHQATRYAAARARQTGTMLTFGITTNATLMDSGDVELFRTYPFAVTVSLDGRQELNDGQRRARSGSAYKTAIQRVRPLLDSPGLARVAARCTITAQDLDVAGRVEHLSQVGFQEVGVSPLKTSPDASLLLSGGDWEVLLNRMREAGEIDWERARCGAGFRFSNLAMALKEIDGGACRPLPCGAGLSYVSVDADGDYFTCHRTVGQAAFKLGDEASGPDRTTRKRFVQSRLVDEQEPCRSCWARYLCGGGCHAEVMAVGRSGCDSIRGWLEFCIRLYPHVLRLRPDLLTPRKDRLSHG